MGLIDSSQELLTQCISADLLTLFTILHLLILQVAHCRTKNCTNIFLGM
jgi:hypothetical protein